MAGFGPPPKEQKRRRNADTYSNIQAELIDDGVLVGPELVGEWTPFVREWWDTWRSSPQAKAFLRTDWMRLRLIAPLVARMEISPHHLVMAEIRQSESLLGATYTDRLRSRMKVERPDIEEKPQVNLSVISDYKKRLAG